MLILTLISMLWNYLWNYFRARARYLFLCASTSFSPLLDGCVNFSCHHSSRPLTVSPLCSQQQYFPVVDGESEYQQMVEREVLEECEKLIPALCGETASAAAPTAPPAAGKRKRGKQENTGNVWYRAVGEEKRRSAEACALTSVERRLYTLHTLPLDGEHGDLDAAQRCAALIAASGCPEDTQEAFTAAMVCTACHNTSCSL